MVDSVEQTGLDKATTGPLCNQIGKLLWHWFVTTILAGPLCFSQRTPDNGTVQKCDEEGWSAEKWRVSGDGVARGW